MRDIIKAGIGIIAAFFLFTILNRISYSLVATTNVFTMIVIHMALIKGEVFGAGMGMACGLVVDSISLGVFGIAGIANTITGFLAGYISRTINVLSLVRSFVFIGIMAGIELGIRTFFVSLVFGGAVNTEKGLIFLQPLSTAFLGSLLLFIRKKIRKKHGEE
jgi:rod shape-determining protein MreD